MAVVLTYNRARPDRCCARSPRRRSCRRRAGGDTASTHGRTATSRRLSPITLVAPTTTAPGRGLRLALEHFLTTPYRHAWVIDDDMRRTRTASSASGWWPSGPRARSSSPSLPARRHVRGVAVWCGFLVAREIIDAVGLPMSELFWWARTPSTAWRAPRPATDAGGGRAYVRHDAIVRATRPVWKYYYEPQPALLHMHVKKRVGYYPRTWPSCRAGRTARARGRSSALEPSDAACTDVARGRSHPVPHRVDAGAHLLTHAGTS